MIRYPSPNDLQRMIPHGDPHIMAAMAVALPYIAERCELNTVPRLAHFLAQACYETGTFHTFEEYASGAEYEGRKDLGNVHPGDGRKYKGRGPFCLTGRFNYSQAQDYVRKATGQTALDIVDEPSAVSEDKAVGIATAIWYWQQHKINDSADKNNCVEVTRKINGGLNGIADRMFYTKKFMSYLSDLQVSPMPTHTMPPICIPQHAQPLPQIAQPQSWFSRFVAAIFVPQKASSNNAQ